jgi:hypothetical protein
MSAQLFIPKLQHRVTSRVNMYVASLRNETATIKGQLFLAFVSVISVRRRETPEDAVTNLVKRIRVRQGKHLLTF